MKHIRVKPAPGMKVRDWRGEQPFIREEGQLVPKDAYFLSRVKDGGLIRIEDKPAPKKAAAKKTEGGDK